MLQLFDIMAEKSKEQPTPKPLLRTFMPEWDSDIEKKGFPEGFMPEWDRNIKKTPKSIDDQLGGLAEKGRLAVETKRLFGNEIFTALKTARALDKDSQLCDKIEHDVLPNINNPVLLRTFIDYFFTVRRISGEEMNIVASFVDKIFASHPDNFDAFMLVIRHGTGAGNETLRELIAQRSPILSYIISRS